ncbi:MAG TPA: hypothetical protein VFS27_10750 [Blastocatellia bacterium]|jgi:hypothetical protein|nr:hypothetical protein [Blastocatellia bacterium]
MPLRDKLILAFTLLLPLTGPYVTYKTMGAGMGVYIDFVVDTLDGPPGPIPCEVTEPWFLPLIVLGIVITAQIWMVILSVGIIREHKRRRSR